MKLIFIFFVFFSFLILQIKPENITRINDIPNSNSKYNEIKEQIVSKIRKLAQENEEEPLLGSPISLIIEFVTYVTGFLDRYSYVDLKNENIEECLYEGIVENLNNKPLLETCIRGSGKSLNDFGNEFECESSFQSEAEYFTLHFYLENTSTLTSKEDAFYIDFVEQHFFYIGLCIPKKCRNAVKYLLNNTQTLDLLYGEGRLSNFTYKYKDDIQNNLTKGVVHYLLMAFTYLSLAKLIIGIGRIIAINKGYQSLAKNKIEIGQLINDGKKSDDENKNEEKENNSRKESSLLKMTLNDQSNNFSEIYNKKINGSFNSNDNLDLYNPFNDNIKKIPFYWRIIKMVDFFDNINILIQLSNKYYNSHNIKSLYLIRLVIMMMSIIYQLVYSQMELPYRGIIYDTFYKFPIFIFIKLCTNASTFWITLDALIIGYKVMTFIKKEVNLSKNDSLNFFNLLKILLLVIPKFVIFILSYICFHLYASELTLEICSRNNVYSSYLYYQDLIQSKTYTAKEGRSIEGIKKFFIPFYINYLDFLQNITKKKNETVNFNSTTIIGNNLTYNYKFYKFEKSDFEVPSPFLTNTSLFVNVYLNEFYLLIIMILIAYFSYILRKKIFDLVILIINIFLFFLPIFDLNKHQIKEKQKYTLRYILGQNYTEKYTHYFINFFYFGFMIGVMKFYHDENKFRKKSKDKIAPIHLPFELYRNIIAFVDKLKFYCKRIILWLSILFLFILSFFSYYKMYSEFKDDKDDKDDKDSYIIIDYEKKLFYKFFLFEKNLNGIFFFIFLIIYITYPKNKNIIKLAETQGFIILERISFNFYCCFSYIIYAQFSIFIIYFQVSYLNIFLNTLGMFLIICSVSILNTTFFELPLRQLIKSLMNKDVEKKLENKFRNYSEESLKIS